MYNLRRVKKNQEQSNSCIGKCYVIVYKETTPDKFRAFLDIYSKSLGGLNEYSEKHMYALISDENGQLIPIFETDDNYIVTDNGSTYCKL
jgi:hypothetical protein